MSQRKYALDILQDTSLTRACLEKLSMEQNLKLSSIEEELNDPNKYRRLVGSIYLIVTRLDILYSVRMLSQCNATQKKGGGGLSQLRGKNVILPLQP